MIISHIIGGLGNQMFQYAAGWAQAKSKKTNLKLDISDFLEYKLHQGFEIDKVFQADVDIATPADMQQVLGWQSNRRINRLLRRPNFTLIRKKSLVIEPHFQYFDAIQEIKPDCYMYGYWQTEKYFKKYESEIRRQFQFKPSPNAQNQVWVELIANTHSVAVHVRRGDFMSRQNIAIHGVCDTVYIDDAIRHVQERMQNPVFFFFSDDVSWVKEKIRTDSPCHYIENNTGDQSFNDMRLMSLCKHNIIANSSFSWWGAWLNAHQGKIVIAPRKWFANGTDTRDLIPDDWIAL